MEQSDLERESELERKGIEKGIERYRKLKEKAKASELEPGERLMVDLIDPLTEAIEKEQETLHSAKSDRGRPKKYSDLMSLPADKLALITVRQALNACANVDTSRITNVVQKIADLVKMEMDFELIVKGIPEEKKKSRIKRIKSSKNRQKVIADIKKEFELTDTRWGPGTREHFGSKLIELLINSTSAFEIDTKYEGIKTPMVLKMSDETMKFLEEEHAICELTRPFYGPMVCPPKPWHNVDEGGYLDFRIDMVKNLRQGHRSILEKQKETLEKVYKALNLIQFTPWRINRKVYRLMKKCWGSNQPLGDLPPKEDPSFPSKPPDYETNEGSKKEWGWKAKEVYEQKAIFRSQRLQLREKLTLAQEYVNEPKIYFPHDLDFRGRVYPIPQNLNPQGDDTSRALLEFAEGKPLGKDGVFWLEIHLAKLFGKDKLSFKDRQKWIRANEDTIIDSAKHPFKGKRFWNEADKPWSALAACLEWYGYSRKGENWVSHIPVAMDGSCNGLQHYSAMGKDVEGGRATNLLYSENPQDIYSQVRDIVVELVEKDAEGGNPEAKVWRGYITRKVVKHGVMTTPYGVKEAGRRDQILDVIKNRKNKEYGIPGSKWENARYLSKFIGKAVDRVIKSALNYEQWLKHVAELLTKKNIPIVWTTPIGFVVYQGYRLTKPKEVKTVLGSLILSVPKSNKLSKRSQKQKLAPNFIHSLDAAHMMMTILAAHGEYGISSFAMIHDSYGVHACDWQNFAPLIRRTFVDIYNKDVLKRFGDEVQERALHEMQARASYKRRTRAPSIKLPDPPLQGDLDINQVLNSKYFFA